MKGTSQNAQRISPTQAEGASYRVHSQFHFILNLFYIIEEFCAYLSAVVRALASHQCGLGSIPAWCDMLVEFVVGFLSSTKTNISKFVLNLRILRGPA